MKPPTVKHPTADLAERVRLEREAQGLAATIEEPEVLRKLSALVRQNGGQAG